MRGKRVDIESKLPPQAIELEEAVLGAILIEKDAIEKVVDFLKPECFYKESNNLVYKTCLELYEKRQPIDILTVTDAARRNGNLESIGGAYYITDLTNRVASAANVEYHGRIIAEKYLLRELIRVSGKYISDAFSDEEDAFELLDNAALEIESLRNFGTVDDSIPFSVQLDQRVQEKKKMVEDGVKVSGISTGNPELDKAIAGFIKGNLIILAARPGMGKSVKALNYAKECALQGLGALVFSLEMSAESLVDRYLVEQARIPFHHYQRNELTESQLITLESAASKLKKLPIHIYDKAAIKTSYIRSKIKAYRKKRGSAPLGLIVIDYLQLMTSTGTYKGQRHLEISEISAELKVIAKEFNIPVIALSQLSREVEQSKDKRPELRHLKESSSIEQDADLVMFIYRPSYYYQFPSHPDEDYQDGRISKDDYDTVAEIMVAKNRNGQPNVMIKEKFYGAYSTFQNYTQETEVTDPFNLPISNHFGSAGTGDSVPF